MAGGDRGEPKEGMNNSEDQISVDCLRVVDDFQIVKVHPSLIAYVDSLQKKNAEALSFYPKCVFEREAEAGSEKKP